ncbi:MAG: hypothetical protein HQL50_08310 [Magnetococcales bacterium]|nr:hypothetical protein [Magnetococcales bacterium]
MMPLITAAVAVGYFGSEAFDRWKKRRDNQEEKPLEPGKSMIHFVREFVEEEEEEMVLASELFPLDNRHGDSPMTSELVLSRSAHSRLEIGRIKGKESTFSGAVFASFNSEVKSQISRALNLDLQNEVRREITLNLTAGPGKCSHFRIIWKQVGRRGYQEVEVGEKFYQIPFLATYGLTASVETVPSP